MEYYGLLKLTALTVVICCLIIAIPAAAAEKTEHFADQVRHKDLSKTIPGQLNYQGFLADAADSSAVDATLEMTFRIIDSETKGAELWSETHVMVSVANGLFQVLLGSVTGFPLNLFDGSDLWLQTEIGPEVLAPRKPLVSTAYSQKSGNADHAVTAEWASDAQHAIYADTATYSQSGGGWTVDGDNVYRMTGKVGIGTASPLTELDVSGSVNATTYYGDGSNLTGVSGTSDGDWIVSDNILHPADDYGLSMRSSNVMRGQHDSTHVNFGIACTTGTSGQDNKYCTVAGGWSNTASGHMATVGGGESNTASYSSATVGGGLLNTASGYIATVAGGQGNEASLGNSTVGGGYLNTASDWYATVGGGRDNTASGYSATVGGGRDNTASYYYASVGGGYANAASDWYATVSGGNADTVRALYGGVAAGYSNLAGDAATDTAAFVGGGYDNSATAKYATVGGGYNNSASGIYATVAGGQNNTATSYSATVAGGQNNTAHDDATVGGGYNNTAGGIYATVGGGYINTASYSHTTVGGGYNNTASGYSATVSGGYDNTASGNSATVGGGVSNYATGNYATLGGGVSNYALGYSATVGGGESNFSDGGYSFTVGFGSNVPSIYSNSAAFNGQTVTSTGQTRIGALSKASGTFTIDHPTEPMNRILNHYFVESPEMVLIYRGVAIIGSDGRAEVHLPDYFDALNRNPMVQLTGVGTSDVYVAEEVKGNSFVVGGKPGTKVYWTVTGDRKDPSAEITRILMPVEQLKEGDLSGHSLDDDFLATTMSQLERMGQAGKFSFRTQAGREKYERSRQALENAGQMEPGWRD